MRTVQPGGKAPGRGEGGRTRIAVTAVATTGTGTRTSNSTGTGTGVARVHIEATLTDFQRGLNGVAGSGGIHRRPPKSILNHLQGVAALFVDARVALTGQQPLDLGLGEI